MPGRSGENTGTIVICVAHCASLVLSLLLANYVIPGYGITDNWRFLYGYVFGVVSLVGTYCFLRVLTPAHWWEGEGFLGETPLMEEEWHMLAWPPLGPPLLWLGSRIGPSPDPLGTIVAMLFLCGGLGCLGLLIWPLMLVRLLDRATRRVRR